MVFQNIVLEIPVGSVALNVWFPVVGEREREKNAVTSNMPRQWNVKKKGNKPAFVDILTRQ